MGSLTTIFDKKTVLTEMNKIFLLIFIAFSLMGCKTNLNETQKDIILETTSQTEFPKPLGAVSDFDKVLTNEQINELSKIITDYESKTTNQIAIVSISDDLNKNNFQQYALDLSNRWGIGTAEKNNGLTIVFSKSLKQIRICTGIGTEKILTDKICETVLTEKILPEFRNGDYYLGLKNGITEFIKWWK